MNTSYVHLVGNLTRDPEVSTVGANNAKKANLGIACNRRWYNKTTQDWDEETSFFNIVAWRDKAEMVEKLLEKGMRVSVSGTLQQRSFEDNDGNNRSIVEVVADEIAIGLWSIESLERRRPNSGGGQATSNAPQPSEAPF